MFVLKFRLSRDRVIVAACILMTTVALLWHSLSLGGVSPRGDSKEARLEFLGSLGYVVEDDSESHKTILLPTKFDKVYAAYNGLQKDVGFDLSRYRGCEAELYTYKLTKPKDFSEAAVSLIVYRNKIIGGDISSLENGGVCLPLATAEENKLKDKQNDRAFG